MSELIKINEEYAAWIKEISQRFRRSQVKAAVKVNDEMLRFYGNWDLIFLIEKWKINMVRLFSTI